MAAPEAPGQSQLNDSDESVDDGIDVTLIRWTLSLSVAERLEVLQAQADALTELRNGLQER